MKYLQGFTCRGQRRDFLSLNRSVGVMNYLHSSFFLLTNIHTDIIHDSSVHGILQARILECVVIPSS